MAEAVFNISADITPEINDRELERQAQQLARQLNSILAKSVDKISVAPERGSFRPFQDEIVRTQNTLQRLQANLGNSVPKAISNVARTGKGAFLKFTDAINVTRRDMVGFGGSILDTLRNTNRFEDAINGIKEAGQGLSSLPQGIEQMIAQVQSGTGILDRFAAQGDKLAQFLQPVAASGAASQKELSELNRTVDILVGAVRQLGEKAGNTGSIIRKQFGQPVFDQQIQSAEKLLALVPKNSAEFEKLKGSIAFAEGKGDLQALIDELIQAKEETQKLTGPIGRIKQFLNEKTGGAIFAKVTKDAREAKIELEQGLIAKIKELGGATALGPIERFTATLRSIGDFGLTVGIRLLQLGDIVSKVSNKFLDFTNLRAPVERLVGVFDTLASDVVNGLARFGGQTVGAVQSIFKSLGTIVSTGIDHALAPLAGAFGRQLGNLGRFLETNLNTPIRDGLVTLRQEVVRLGGEITHGFATGIQTGKTFIGNAVKTVKDVLVTSFQTLFRIHSPSQLTNPYGRDVAAGFAQGIQGGAGLVQKAVNTLLHPVSTLANGAKGFVKSGVAVLSTALAGLGGVALHAGIEFNTLQQVVRGTLPVLVGSKKASADLLTQVNLLNDRSPFARSAFLQLTQTLAGFGVEAKKITPLIDAIQQTVAATGGGEQDLQELGGAFAKIQSQGRLSLDILQSFSVRGVDAIGILGQAFGKTQSEVRDMISNGLVPAGKAIDALTSGLKTKFDGATEAVARNLPGALDRIKAKLRDAGAELTRAFVNPEGGGALVDFLNSISTSISHITKNLLPQIRPLLEFVAVGFANVGKAVQTFVTNIQGSAIPGFIDKLGSIAPTLAALAGLFPKVFSFIPVIGPQLAALGGPFTAFIFALGALIAQSQKVREALKPIIDNFITLFKVIGPVVQGVLPKLQELFADIVVAIAPLISDISAGLIPLVIKAGETIGVWAEKLRPVIAALGEFLNSLRPSVALVFQFANGLLNAAQSGAGPISGALIKIAQTLTKLAPLVNALIFRFVAMKSIGLIITFLSGGFQKMIGVLIDLTLKIPIVSTAFTGLGVAASEASIAINSILGPLGLIALGIGLFLQFRNHAEKGAKSLDDIGNAALNAAGKFKIAFNTEDLQVFNKTLDEIRANAEAIAGKQPTGPVAKNAFQAATTSNQEGGTEHNAILAAEALKQLEDAENKRTEALKRATEAGQKGNVVEFKQAINAQKNGEFLIKEAAFRDQLNAAVLKGAEDLARANVAQEQSSNLIQKLTDNLKSGKGAYTTLQQAAIDSAAAIKDNYSAATKAVQDANAALSGAIDSLKQGLSTIDQKLSAVFSAARAAQDASKAVTNAREKAAEINADLAKTEDDYRKALRDVITPTDELNKALRDQTRVKNSLRDLDQELTKLTEDDAKLQTEKLKLTGQEAADDRAGLARAEQRAQISLNQAKQAELDLLNELNGANKVSINLAGLSLDQIRAKLAAVRLSSGKDRKKTAQEIADAKTSAHLDVEDAEQAKKDSTQAKADFEVETKEKIKDIDVQLRENDERRQELQDDRLDKLLDEQEAQKTVNKLREGETSQAAIIKDFDDKIKDFKEKQATAAEAITTAVKAEQLAKADLVLQTATIRGDTQLMATAQQTIWNLKSDGLNNLDPKTLTAIQTQKSQVSLLLAEYQKITAEVQRTIKIQEQAASFQKAGAALGSFETLSAADTADLMAGRGQNPVTKANIEKTKKDVLDGIRAALEAGGAENKRDRTPFLPAGAQVNQIMAAITAEFMKPNTNLRDAIARALNSFGLSMPGFAAARGLSPGMIHPGMHNGKGLVRMFEFGKEAVLPLTRPSDMKRIVTDPRVLPAVMKALPGFAKGFAPGDDIILNALSTPDNALRKILQDLFRQMGLQFPGFATGYAPGDLGSVGSSYKPFSVSDTPSSILSPMLNALPRWSAPQSGGEVSLDSGTSSDLSTVVRSARMGGGPANSDVYEKKSQRDFANTIGEAVRVAVKSAIEESGGMGGDDIDINVNPNASETQRAIAREVKRQLDKRTGKW